MQDNMTYLIIIGAAVVALAALAALVNYVLSIVRGFRRDPPLPEELAKGYATKREVSELKQEINAEIAELKHGIYMNVSELKRDISASIAELKHEFTKERQRVDAILKEQYDLIRELTSKTNEWHQSVNLMLGRIEGKVNNK